MEWIDTNEKTPLCFERGEWDGRKSSNVLAEDIEGKKYIAHLYEGFLDGGSFQDWFDGEGYSINKSIVRWMEIPD